MVGQGAGAIGVAALRALARRGQGAIIHATDEAQIGMEPVDGGAFVSHNSYQRPASKDNGAIGILQQYWTWTMPITSAK